MRVAIRTARARTREAAFACLPIIIVVLLLFGSHASAEPWLEDSARADEAESEKTPDCTRITSTDSKW